LALRKQEREAEVFSTYFLIPEEKLSAMLKEKWMKDSPDHISESAEEFHGKEAYFESQWGKK
jgi:Zn-dependent peptidase ImmA (M78 family)